MDRSSIHPRCPCAQGTRTVAPASRDATGVSRRGRPGRLEHPSLLDEAVDRVAHVLVAFRAAGGDTDERSCHEPLALAGPVASPARWPHGRRRKRASTRRPRLGARRHTASAAQCVVTMENLFHWQYYYYCSREET